MCRTLNSILKHDTTIISLFLLGKTCSVTIFGSTIKFKKLCCWGWENLCSSIWNKMIVNIATVCQMNHTSIILKYAVSGNSVVIELSKDSYTSKVITEPWNRIVKLLRSMNNVEYEIKQSKKVGKNVEIKGMDKK